VNLTITENILPIKNLSFKRPLLILNSKSIFGVLVQWKNVKSVVVEDSSGR